MTRTRRIPPVLRWIFWVLLVQFILVNISASIYAYRLTHFYTDPALANRKQSKNILVRTWKIFTGPKFIKAPPGSMPDFPVDTVIFTTESGLKIHAWFSAADSAQGTIILFHGVTANKSLMIPEANAFLKSGLNVMLVDFRGHGRSEGKTTTLGYREAEEVKLAFDHIISRGEKNVFLYGVSMGASVIARAVSIYNLKPRAMILEMPFASMQSHLQARARTLGFPGFPERPFGFLVSTWIGWERGFNGPRHKTTRYAGDIRCPVLIQWGTEDELVKKWEVDAIYHALKTPNKKLITYPGASHESLYRFDPVKWQNEIDSLIR